MFSSGMYNVQVTDSNGCSDSLAAAKRVEVKPLPKAARTIVSPSFTLPCSQASVKAITMDAAVVFPYF